MEVVTTEEVPRAITEQMVVLEEEEVTEGTVIHLEAVEIPLIFHQMVVMEHLLFLSKVKMVA